MANHILFHQILFNNFLFVLLIITKYNWALSMFFELRIWRTVIFRKVLCLLQLALRSLTTILQFYSLILLINRGLYLKLFIMFIYILEQWLIQVNFIFIFIKLQIASIVIKNQWKQAIIVYNWQIHLRCKLFKIRLV